MDWLLFIGLIVAVFGSIIALVSWSSRSQRRTDLLAGISIGIALSLFTYALAHPPSGASVLQKVFDYGMPVVIVAINIRTFIGYRKTRMTHISEP